MPQNPPDFGSLIRSLSDEHVPFVVIGGLAMILHGGDYATIDTDFAISTDPAITDAVVRSLAPFNPRPSHLPNFKDFPWDGRSIFGAVISLATDAGDVDLLRIIPGVDSFEGLLVRSQTFELFGLQIQVASIDDLIAMKTVANRPKDLDHIRMLTSIKKLHDSRTGEQL